MNESKEKINENIENSMQKDFDFNVLAKLCKENYYSNN